MIKLQFKLKNSRKWHDSSLSMHEAGSDTMHGHAKELIRQEGWIAARCVDKDDETRVLWIIQPGGLGDWKDV